MFHSVCFLLGPAEKVVEWKEQVVLEGEGAVWRVWREAVYRAGCNEGVEAVVKPPHDTLPEGLRVRLGRL